jgi:hypothetical protein
VVKWRKHPLMAKYASKESCNKAKELMDQVKRLGGKTGVKILPKRLQEIKNKITNGSLTYSDLPGSLQTEFPGEFKSLTYNEIKNRCKEVGINFDK